MAHTGPFRCGAVTFPLAEFPFARAFEEELDHGDGHLTAMLSDQGCLVTTVDHVDRGASGNLAGLGVEVVVADGEQYLADLDDGFDLVVIDLHGNTEEAWRRRAPPSTRTSRTRRSTGWSTASRSSSAGAHRRRVRRRNPSARGWRGSVEVGQAFFVSQKISEISSILPRNSSATATSMEPLVPPAPASFVASLKRLFNWGYFSKWGGLK